MNSTGNKSLVTLLALKALCCGGIILALGGISVGGISAIFSNGWVQGAGIALIMAYAAHHGWVRRNIQRGAAHDRKADRTFPTEQAEK